MTTIFGWVGLVALGFKLDKLDAVEMMANDPDTIIGIKYLLIPFK